MIRFRRRWTYWWIAAIAAPHWAALAFVLAIFPAKAWYMAPLVVPGAYWVLAAIANWRSATVRAEGVRLTLVPFPVGGGSWIPRDSIAGCYARRVVETNDSDLVVADYFAMGVETLDGKQRDLHLPYGTEAEALAAAGPVAAMLGGVPVRTVEAQFSYPTAWRATLLWTGIAAITLAAAARIVS